MCFGIKNNNLTVIVVESPIQLLIYNALLLRSQQLIFINFPRKTKNLNLLGLLFD